MYSPIRIPRSLHELFGEQSNPLDLALTLGFAVLATGMLFWATAAEWAGLAPLGLAVTALLSLDICGGVIANFTAGTNRFYRERPRLRLVFIAVHVQPLLLAFALGGYFIPCLAAWAYTALGALLVNALSGQPAQRVTGAVVMAAGLLGLLLLFGSLPRLLLALLMLFLVKVTFSFAVDHAAPQSA